MKMSNKEIKEALKDFGQMQYGFKDTSDEEDVSMLVESAISNTVKHGSAWVVGTALSIFVTKNTSNGYYVVVIYERKLYWKCLTNLDLVERILRALVKKKTKTYKVCAVVEAESSREAQYKAELLGSYSFTAEETDC